MKILKRIFRVILAIIIIIPIGCFSFFLFIGPALNDVRTSTIEKKLSHIELPPKTEIIETASFCGNTGGTGNHVEIWAGILIHTDISEEEINDFFDMNKFNEYQTVWHVPEDLTKEYPAPRDFIDLSFSYCNEQGHEFFSGKRAIGYYIVGGYYNAFTQWDIRGH